MATRQPKKPFDLKEGEQLVLIPVQSFVYQPPDSPQPRSYMAKRPYVIDLSDPVHVELAKTLIAKKLVRALVQRSLDVRETR